MPLAVWKMYFHMIMGPSNETLNKRHHYYPVTPNSWCKYWVDQSIIQAFTTKKTVCHPSFAVSCIIYLCDCLQIHYCKAVRADIKLERKLENMVWGLIVESVCSAVLTVYNFLFVKLLLPQGLFQKNKKQTVGGEGVEVMEFPGGLKK